MDSQNRVMSFSSIKLACLVWSEGRAGRDTGRVWAKPAHPQLLESKSVKAYQAQEGMDPLLGVPPREITRLVGKDVLTRMLRAASHLQIQYNPSQIPEEQDTVWFHLCEELEKPSSKRQKVGGGLGEGKEFLFHRYRVSIWEDGNFFWRWMVVTVTQQRECAWCHRKKRLKW